MSMKFPIAEAVTDQDAIMVAEKLPALTGNGNEDILCGSCNQVLAEKLTPQAIRRMAPTENRLVLRCTCGANNLVADEASTGSDPEVQGAA